MLREFTDKEGLEWRVWDVDPQAHQSQVNIDRRKAQPLEGWLCFESNLERRRLSPIPSGWDATDPDRLAELCEKAQVVPPITRHFESPPRRPPS